MPRILCMEYYEHKNFNSYQAGRNLAVICLYFQYLFMRSGTTGKLELLSSIVPRVALACRNSHHVSYSFWIGAR